MACALTAEVSPDSSEYEYKWDRKLDQTVTVLYISND